MDGMVASPYGSWMGSGLLPFAGAARESTRRDSASGATLPTATALRRNSNFLAPFV